MQVSSQVQNQQAVVAIVSEIAQYERLLRQHRTVKAAGSLPPEHDILAAQSDKVLVEVVEMRVSLTLGKVQLRALESRRVPRIGQYLARLRTRKAPELR